MAYSNLVQGPIASHFKLSMNQSPQTEEEKNEKQRIPYASDVGMYAMICIRPDLAYAVSLVSRFMSTPGKEYWQAMKWSSYM